LFLLPLIQPFNHQMLYFRKNNTIKSDSDAESVV
jgi:hypothetical protein